MKIILTGNSGFIGTRLYNYLTQLGYEVESISKTEFISRDFSRLRDFYCDGSGEQADAVIHLAWPRLPDIHDLNHLAFAYTSCDFLEECSRSGIRVINIGSHNEYGCKFEAAKETDICEPIDTYGLGKLMVTLHAKKLGFNTLRLFAVYGEGGRTFKDIVDRENAKYAMPENVKDFVSVEQVCYAIERLVHAKHLYGEIINVCTGKQETAEEIAREVEGLDMKWHKYAQRQYEPSIWEGDPSKMEKLLNLRAR